MKPARAVVASLPPEPTGAAACFCSRCCVSHDGAVVTGWCFGVRNEVSIYSNAQSDAGASATHSCPHPSTCRLQWTGTMTTAPPAVLTTTCRSSAIASSSGVLSHEPWFPFPFWFRLSTAIDPCSAPPCGIPQTLPSLNQGCSSQNPQLLGSLRTHRFNLCSCYNFRSERCSMAAGAVCSTLLHCLLVPPFRFLRHKFFSFP